jgi:hypothetical protein
MKKWKRIYLIYLIAGALIIRDFFQINQINPLPLLFLR